MWAESDGRVSHTSAPSLLRPKKFGILATDPQLGRGKLKKDRMNSIGILRWDPGMALNWAAVKELNLSSYI